MDPNIDHTIFYHKQHANGEIRIHCHICVHHGKMEDRRCRDKGDYIEKGVKMKDKDKKVYQDRHLISIQHKNSVKRKAEKEKDRITTGESTKEEREQATKNLCRAVQYGVDRGQTYRDLGYLCAFLDLITPKEEMNPLGTTSHSTKNYPDLLLSNQESVKKSLENEMNKFNIVTKQEKRFALCVDKGTAKGDATRQAVVANYIDNEVPESKDILLSADRIFDKSSKGCLIHLKKSCEGIIKHKRIVTTCTDSENVYSGNIA